MDRKYGQRGTTMGKKAVYLIGFGFLAVMAFGIFYWGGESRVPLAEAGNQDRFIQGQIVSQYGPVEGARVRVAGDEKYTLTDGLGRFELQTTHLPPKTVRVTAGKEGWFNNGGNAYPVGDIGKIFLNAVPRADHPGYRFISPVTCARCHIELTRYWDQSKMAHTTSNPKVLNMYYGTDASNQEGVGPGYKLDYPKSGGNCTICHAPSVAVSDFGLQDLNGALMSPRTEWDGISCDYCHKVRKVIRDLNKPSGYRAILGRQTPLKGNTILVYGPYDDVVNSAMAAIYNPLYNQGQFCATCHSHIKKLDNDQTWNRRQVYNDMEWNGFGLKDDSSIPIQTTYQEWRLWQNQLAPDDANKGKKCQDCHMGWRKEMLPYGNYVVDKQARNMWGVKRKPKNIRPHQFDGGTAIQLKTSLAMEIEGKIIEKTLSLKVFITNTNGGHWVPTGETMRSVMLVLDVRDESGQPLKLIDGQRLPDWTGNDPEYQNSYAGRPGAVFARVLQDEAGRLNVPFWKATSIALDSRIRPKTTVTLVYNFRLDDPDGEPTAEARLIYRPAIESLAKIKSWKDPDILITSSAW